MLSQLTIFSVREQIFGARLLLSLFYNLPMCASLPNVKRTSASIAYRYQRWLRERDELNNNGSSSQHAIQGRADYPANFDWISSSGRERGREIEEARQREGKRQGGERIGTTGRWSKISFVANKSTAKLVRGRCQCDSTASGSVSFCIFYAREWKLPRDPNDDDDDDEGMRNEQNYPRPIVCEECLTYVPRNDLAYTRAALFFPSFSSPFFFLTVGLES